MTEGGRNAKIETLESNNMRILQKLRNKTVAIVGPSPSIKGMGLGGVVDSHEWVVRLNIWVGLPEEDYGSKNSLFVISRTDQVARMVRKGIPRKNIRLKNAICPAPKHIEFADEWLPQELKGKLTFPTTGVRAVLALVQVCTPSIYGFSFYNPVGRKYHPECEAKLPNEKAKVDLRKMEKGLLNSKHKFDLEEFVVYKMWESGRVSVDPFLEEHWGANPPKVESLIEKYA